MHAGHVTIATSGTRRGSPPTKEVSLLPAFAILALCFLAVVLSIAFAVRPVQAFRRALGGATAALRLAPVAWMLRGLQAQGTFQGRPIAVRTLPDARRTPAMLEVKLAVRASQNLVVGPAKGAVAQALAGVVSHLTDRVDVPLGGPWLARSVSAEDPAFATALLRGPAGELAYRVTQAPTMGQVRYLKITPGEVILLVSGYVLTTTTPAALLAWVTDLAGVANAVERT